MYDYVGARAYTLMHIQLLLCVRYKVIILLLLLSCLAAHLAYPRQAIVPRARVECQLEQRCSLPRAESSSFDSSVGRCYFRTGRMIKANIAAIGKVSLASLGAL